MSDDRPWWNVHRWPRWLRRLFVCTFPISGLLWCAGYVIGWTLFYCFAVPLAIFNTLVGDYWNDEPRANT
jgi:hypothetical protein